MVQSLRSAVLLAGSFAVLPACCAEAIAIEAAKSSYTSIAERACRKASVLRIEDTEYAVSRICPGRGGYKVFIDEEDLRETLTVGKTASQAAREPAARDHYGAFNAYEDTIEWRSGRDGKPFAIIVGWSFADNENTDATGAPQSDRLLVVFRLPPGPVCKVAYVDRTANRDANALARKAADETARDFRCDADVTQVIGERGRAIDAMLPAAAAGKP
jgi:hypothetical protein